LLGNIPSGLKRRLTPLAKTVFSAIRPCAEGLEAMPAVFSSTHGELAKSLAMIQLLEADEEISPTAFSLCVHNAIAGLYSIVYANTSELTVLAPGAEGLAAAFLEALGLLQEGAPAVLMVLYDEPLPEFYPSAPFRLSAESCALAMKLTKTGAGLPVQLSRDATCGDDGEQPVQLPGFIDFLATTCTQFQLLTPRQRWRWQKLAAQP